MHVLPKPGHRRAVRASLLPITFLFLLTLVASLPASASAMLVGIESNSEFVNADRTPALQDPAIEKAYNAGAQVIRGNVGWADIAAGCGGQSAVQLASNANPCYSWSVIDNLVAKAKARQIQMLFSVSRTPAWLFNNTPQYVGTTDAEFTTFVDHYTAFITAIVSRYGEGSPHGTVRLWTIWNEPNSIAFWQPLAKANYAKAPVRYAQLYARAAVALKAANPKAAVAAGPTGPNSPQIKPLTYIAAFQKALPAYLPKVNPRRYINAWAHNPYPGNNNVSPRRPLYKAPSVGIGNLKDLFAQLDKSALTKRMPMWATEFGFETNPPDRTFGISYLKQASQITDSFDVLDATNRVPIAIQYGLTDPSDLNDWQSGLFTTTGKAKPALASYQRMIAVSAVSVRKGTRAAVWGRANVNPRLTRIQYSLDGKAWKTYSNKPKLDGSIRINVPISRTMWFATTDGHVRGPARVVLAR